LSVQTSFHRSFAYVSVASSLPITGQPRIKVTNGTYEATLSVRSASLRRFFSSFSLDLLTDTPVRVEASAEVNGTPDVVGYDVFTLHPITRQQGGTVLSDDGAFRLVFPPNGVYETMYVRLEHERGSYAAEPGDVLLDRGATVEMDIPPNLAGKRVGLFSTDGDLNLLSWRRGATETTLRGRVTRFLGRYAIMEDETPPSIARVTTEYRGGTLSGSFRITDDRAGVNASSIRVMLGETMLIPEYETETKRVRFSERLHLKKGRHTLVIEASDDMTNTRRTEHAFNVR
jgi:hypothetical protein